MGLAHIVLGGHIMTTKTETSLTKAQTTALGKLPTKSAKIRFLTGLDWTRSQIATKLGIRYQHVRNVQITPIKAQRS